MLEGPEAEYFPRFLFFLYQNKLFLAHMFNSGVEEA